MARYNNTPNKIKVYLGKTTLRHTRPFRNLHFYIIIVGL